MFNHIGRKIKGLAKFICWIGILLSILVGVVIIAGGDASELSDAVEGAEQLAGMGWIGGVLVIIIGSLASWIGSFFMYGFGQLIENTDRLVQK